ncbi:MAG: hypothetical protein QOI47_527, partial [Actinomycetota bacterium]|nr:hypothetical protein [Actinomycetota bacterium]
APLRYSVTQEDATVTADRLSSGGGPGFDVWVVPEPWPEMVDAVRARGGLPPLFPQHAGPVASSPLVSITSSTARCDWKCVGTGASRIGAVAPTKSLGLLELGAAASGHLGRADFAANDFDAAFQSWVTSFTGRIEATDQPTTRLLQSRAFFDIAITFEVEGHRELARASADRKAGLTLQYPAPVAHLDVVIVDVGAALADRARDVPGALGAALRAEGWQAPDATPSGLPKAGVLVALRALVR